MEFELSLFPPFPFLIVWFPSFWEDGPCPKTDLSFQPAVELLRSIIAFLQEQLAVNDGRSMMEAKRLQNAPLRDARMVAVYNAMDALAERFVDGAPIQRFADKKKLLECKP